MRNDPRRIYQGVMNRIRRAIAKDQLWKLTRLHMWRLEFPIEATRGF